MKCVRCGSSRMVKFIDGFGQRRVFCRKCWGSFPDRGAIVLREQKRLQEFRLHYPHKPNFNSEYKHE